MPFSLSLSLTVVANSDIRYTSHNDNITYPSGWREEGSEGGRGGREGGEEVRGEEGRGESEGGRK